MNLSEMTITDIKGLCTSQGEVDAELLQALAMDSREGVRKLYARLQKNRLAHEKELRRLAELNKFERTLRAQGYQKIAGVDEVGRGPLAGPVVAAAVVLPPDAIIKGLNDSKKVAEAKREVLAEEIKAKAIAWSVQVVDVAYIEEFNILQAALRAMELAVKDLGTEVDYVLVDAVTIPRIKLPQKPIIGGDALSASIAAASILAKVTRDGLMKELHEVYPVYGFDRHKGYGSADHCAALREFGPSPIHRKLFIRRIMEEN